MSPLDFSTGVSQVIVPDSINPVFGYRGWNIRAPFKPAKFSLTGVVDNEFEIKSYTNNTAWKPNEQVEAICGGEDAPQWSLYFQVLDDSREWHAKYDKQFAINEILALDELPWNFLESLPRTCKVNKIDRKHIAPKTKCTCGLYATKELSTLLMQYSGTFGLFGKVAMWGQIVEATDGYRAQYAYPTEFYICREYKPMFQTWLYHEMKEYLEQAWNLPVSFIRIVAEIY